MARPRIPHQMAPLPVPHHCVRHFFCRVGRILAADQCRPVPQVPPCLGGEGGSFHSFHPWERTEVRHLYLLLWCKCSGSADGGGFLLSVDVDKKILDLLLKSVALPVLAFTYLPSITPLHHSSSISLRRWRRRNRALWRSVRECPGLVLQTGSAGFTLKA